MSAQGNLDQQQFKPLPMEDDLFYRAHPKDASFGPERASSTILGDSAGESTKHGYSTFQNPWQLDHYMHEMNWYASPEHDPSTRTVIAFRGDRVGTGANGEPLAMPRSGKPEVVMPWDEFQKRLDITPEYHLPLLPPESRPPGEKA